MRLLDLTLPTPQENLALDEALLEEAEDKNREDEILRLWEAPAPLVVIGRSSRHADEVYRERCLARNIPVLRRSSGGAAVVAGPGCLMYAVVLSHVRRPYLTHLDEAHRAVLAPLAQAIDARVPGVRWQGTSDLAWNGRKVSGNSLRCKRAHVLYHGTLLYGFDLALIGELLASPPRQPEYRAGRDHAAFVANLPLDASSLRQAVCQAFDAQIPLDDWPRQRTARLAAEKYALAQWNERL
jgi:lipoate-protein ligase A